ncbi:MAG: sulfotransferase family 2 domain-containing protein [Salaquimonas sp.]|nr:sulfotransferase family 2 domain-containing protein [Salaquimonas sp.]
MTLTDEAKHPVIFLHLQKTGGTTVEHLLRSWFRDRNFASRDRTGKIAVDVLRGSDMILSGHFLASELPPIADDAIVTTVLREPVERLLSHCYFLKSYTEDHLAGFGDSFLLEVKRTPLAELVASEVFAHRFGDFYVRKLDPKYQWEQPRSLASPQRALRFLERCNVIGITNRLDDYIHRLMRKLQVPEEAEIPRLNARSDIARLEGFEAVERESLDEHTIETIEALLARDRKLYNCALAMVV